MATYQKASVKVGAKRILTMESEQDFPFQLEHLQEGGRTAPSHLRAWMTGGDQAPATHALREDNTFEGIEIYSIPSKAIESCDPALKRA
jgi:hypothetical protein